MWIVWRPTHLASATEIRSRLPGFWDRPATPFSAGGVSTVLPDVLGKAGRQPWVGLTGEGAVVLGGARGHCAGRASWEERGRLREGWRRWAGPPFPRTLPVLRSDVARAPPVPVVAAGALIRSRSPLSALPRVRTERHGPAAARCQRGRLPPGVPPPLLPRPAPVRASSWAALESGARNWGVGPGVRGVRVLRYFDPCPVESTLCLAWPAPGDVANGSSGREGGREGQVEDGLYVLKTLLTELTTL